MRDSKLNLLNTRLKTKKTADKILRASGLKNGKIEK